ncbi:hypothetical protein ZWY2020_008001 [Hordeum vulgare]|nr:hypothetical protein ZWY2020_008001 [Hordeum vulgare]
MAGRSVPEQQGEIEELEARKSSLRAANSAMSSTMWVWREELFKLSAMPSLPITAAPLRHIYGEEDLAIPALKPSGTGGEGDLLPELTKPGLYNHTSSSRMTLHLNRFGVGKHRLATTTCAARRPCSSDRPAPSCRCNRGTSLDQLAAPLHRSFTATTPYPPSGAGDGSGRFDNSSSSIHSGHRCVQVTLLATRSRCTAEAVGSSVLH